jgi:protein TonB
VIAGSFALHVGIVSLFWHEAPPLASIGIEAISVDFTLGATTAAGVAPTPGEQEAQAAAASEERAVEEAVPVEKTPVATLLPQEVPVATQETAPEAGLQEIKPRPEPEATVAENVEAQAADVAPAEQAPEPKLEETPRPTPPVVTAEPAPESKRLNVPTQQKAKPAQQKQHVAAAPTDSASGVGRGRSDRDANYNGTVAAHLARHKQYPTDARAVGAQGVASVSFVLDGSGRVTSVSLARPSGNPSIDREVLAMVRRASPFPRPPDGRGRNYTVPVRFNLR